MIPTANLALVSPRQRTDKAEYPVLRYKGTTYRIQKSSLQLHAEIYSAAAATDIVQGSRSDTSWKRRTLTGLNTLLAECSTLLLKVAAGELAKNGQAY
jgi:hypothetical protein